MFRRLDASQIRQTALRPVSVGLIASSPEAYREMEDFLAPASSPDQDRARALGALCPVEDSGRGCDFILSDAGSPLPANGYLFEPDAADSLVDSVLAQNADIELALAHTFPPFRTAVAGRLIHRVARENALFSMMTALPNIIPSFIELPWAIGEFASDTAFLTMNQVRLAFLLSAAHGHPAGYDDLRFEIAAIVAGAFGWRAIARELAGKIPLGGGLIPTAAVSYAATWVVGLGVDKSRRTGSPLTRAEREAAFGYALSKGREVAGGLDFPRAD